MNETIEAYKKAIEVCDEQRSRFPISQATPNQLHLYNVFTRAKGELKQHLATIEDSLGVYNLKDKNEG